MYEREIFMRVLTPIAKQRMEENKCPSCGKLKSKWNRRTDWTCCSTKCTEKYYKEHDKSISWSGQRRKALRRDNFTCKRCGVRHAIHLDKYTIDFEDDGKLEVDHIKPVSIGGDSLDLENLQTLCINCHKIKTAEDMKVISEFRMIEKQQNKNHVLM